MTERQFNLFMFMGLQKMAYEWSEALPLFDNNYMRNKFRDAYKANTLFMNHVEKNFSEDLLEQFWDNSEVFSKVLEMILKAETAEKKQELFLVMDAYVKGNVKIEE